VVVDVLVNLEFPEPVVVREHVVGVELLTVTFMISVVDPIFFLYKKKKCRPITFEKRSPCYNPDLSITKEAKESLHELVYGIVHQCNCLSEVVYSRS
jgi:hypothetical protein